MSSASPKSRDLARRLLAVEAPGGKKSGRPKSSVRSLDHGVQAVRVCEKLRLVLTVYTGAVGVRSLLTRALALAKAQEPALAPVQVLEDGSLTGFEKVGLEKSNGSNDRQMREVGGEVLVAHLLDLLVTFIGEPLMLRLVQEAWPNASARSLRLQIKDTP